jgi:hypothetical protein
MTRRMPLLFLVALLALAGCWAKEKEGPTPAPREGREAIVWKSKLSEKVRRTLDKADSFDLYSLEPEQTKGQASAEKLHDWPVLGKTTVSDPRQKRALLQRLDAAVAEPGKGGSNCFMPRHAIRVDHYGDVVELLICFECGWVYVYVNGEQQHPHEEVERAAQPAFDGALRDAGVPLAKKRH